MANQVHIGRLSFTSPGNLNFSSTDGGRELSISGKIGGVELTLDHVKYIRDELISLAAYGLTIPFRYDGDSTYDGYVKIRNSSVQTQKYVRAGFNYSVDFCNL